MSASDFMGQFSRSARGGLLVGALLVLAGLAAALWWLFSPDYGLLFGNLQEADAAEVTKSLTEWKVPYRFTNDGTGIEVKKDQVYDTRMKLVSAGIPSGGHVGFELFNDSDFGVTEFAQRVNYQRALQGELERSIGALPGVETVRVHLTIRRPGLFVGQSDSSKASVAVSMSPGEVLTPKQVGGIRNLIASAVEGLDPASVVVLGPGGVLSGGASGAAGAGGLMGQNEEQASYEAHVRERISDMLSQAFKLKAFKVSVDARLNFDQVRKVSERLIAQGTDGNGLVIRKRSSRNGSGKTDADAAAAPTQNQEEFDYAHGTEREEISRAPGKVERLSVAVMVPPTLTSTELERLRKLVTAAAGLDSERGDRLEIGAIADGVSSVDAGVAANPLLVPVTEPTVEEARPAKAQSANWIANVLWLSLAGAIGLLIGWLLSASRQPSVPRLAQEEREAVLLRLRSWLAEGETA